MRKGEKKWREGGKIDKCNKRESGRKHQPKERKERRERELGGREAS